MTATYIAFALLTTLMAGFYAVVDLLRCQFVLANMAKLGLGERWLPVLGSLKGAAAIGLLLGLLGVPLIGTAAAAGLVLFFIGAIATHVLAHDRAIAFALGCLLLAAVTLTLDLLR